MSFSLPSVGILIGTTLIRIAFLICGAPAWVDILVCILTSVPAPWADRIVFAPFLRKDVGPTLDARAARMRLICNAIACVAVSWLLLLSIPPRGIGGWLVAMICMQSIGSFAAQVTRCGILVAKSRQG